MVSKSSTIEDLGLNKNFWRNKRVLLTGHTGFKGSWLSIWLQSMGANLQGLALDPPSMPNLFVEAKIAEGMVSNIADIRDYDKVYKIIAAFKPEIVIHMAAQPLVRYSYKNPIETYATNIMGTVHVLEAIRQVDTTKVVINVTTDKCYENKESGQSYSENEPMGGFDPYSSSKGCSELITSAYRRSYFQETGIALASARAGNVIGGGDWAEDRLIPDTIRAIAKNQSVIIRYPNATRPWQHVLEPLSGYLILAEKLWHAPTLYADGWNFGPKEDDIKPVSWIVQRLCSLWGGESSWQLDAEHHPHEAAFLKLNIEKAKLDLAWTPTWSLEIALEKIVSWYKNFLQNECMRGVVEAQLAEFLNDYSRSKS